MAKLYFTKQLMTSEYDIGIYFKTERERNLYFNIPSIFDLSKDFNFNISGGLSATLYWNEASFLNTSILDYNYVIIDINRQYYFYFINSAKCVTANQYQIDLELDVITTYLPLLKFEDCFIERAHANRWYTTDNINYKFNFSTNSPLLRKSEQYKQYLKQQIPLHRTYDNVSNANDFERTRYLYIFAKLKDNAKLIIKERILTTEAQKAITNFKVELIGKNSSVEVLSRSVAKNNSHQEFNSNIIGKNDCFAMF